MLNTSENQGSLYHSQDSILNITGARCCASEHKVKNEGKDWEYRETQVCINERIAVWSPGYPYSYSKSQAYGGMSCRLKIAPRTPFRYSSGVRGFRRTSAHCMSILVL